MPVTTVGGTHEDHMEAVRRHSKMLDSRSERILEARTQIISQFTQAVQGNEKFGFDEPTIEALQCILGVATDQVLKRNF